MHSPLLATLTHARLRIAQGDLAAARDILHELLVAEPDNDAARTLLDGLAGRAPAAYVALPDEAPPPPQPGNPRDLARSFRILRGDRDPRREQKIRRLRAWASRISGDGAGSARPAD